MTKHDTIRDLQRIQGHLDALKLVLDDTIYELAEHIDCTYCDRPIETPCCAQCSSKLHGGGL